MEVATVCSCMTAVHFIDHDLYSIGGDKDLEEVQTLPSEWIAVKCNPSTTIGK